MRQESQSGHKNTTHRSNHVTIDSRKPSERLKRRDLRYAAQHQTPVEPSRPIGKTQILLDYKQQLDKRKRQRINPAGQIEQAWPKAKTARWQSKNLTMRHRHTICNQEQKRSHAKRQSEWIRITREKQTHQIQPLESYFCRPLPEQCWYNPFTHQQPHQSHQKGDKPIGPHHLTPIARRNSGPWQPFHQI